ncbi:sensor histidine kinase [Mastigocoleus testarum]|uniref:Histidine kinase n=1 Tax=Mastigocoleus testarum BC008 TaxID=371196 RepID=A0A0V7ZNQ9_9CYAN|nr:ATP-binding protein [Mastigocoleus testarum]KST66201.1 histidine kinase [Mastigocoleus testarum BC008]
MAQKFEQEILSSFISEGSDRDLGLDSTLQELSLYNFAVEMSCPTLEVAELFNKYPLLPGVILVERGEYFGMISRQRLLEFLIRPHGKDLLYQSVLSVIYSYARTPILVLSEETPILSAMQLTLRRDPELLAEPLVVHSAPNIYRMLRVQDLNLASWQIRGIETQVRYERTQAQIIQNDKMAHLGRLVDGVAHEILDPVNFIWGNLSHVSNYSQDLIKLLLAYERECVNVCEEVKQFKEEIEFEFLEQDLTKALSSIRTGAERLKKLVISLQNFCHIDEIYPKPTDLHVCLDSIILLINSRINGEIAIVKNYGHLPPVYCFLGELNQVFMNIFSQAVDSLLDEAIRQDYNKEKIKIADKPQIEVTTEVISQAATIDELLESRWIAIRITDNSQGMSQEMQQQIMESFSLDERVNKETSIAVSYRIITARHGGKFNITSTPGSGNQFEILLPLVGIT